MKPIHNQAKMRRTLWGGRIGEYNRLDRYSGPLAVYLPGRTYPPRVVAIALLANVV